MPQAAVATFQRIAKKCPKCGDPSLKELIGAPGREFKPIRFLLLLMFGGFGLLIYPLWLRRVEHLQAHCPKCGTNFDIRSSSGLLWIAGGVVALALAASAISKTKDTEPASAPTATASAQAMPAAAPKPASSESSTDSADAQRRAVASYPDLAKSGSPLNVEFVARYTRYKKERPEFFKQLEWPTALAKECSEAKADVLKP